MLQITSHHSLCISLKWRCVISCAHGSRAHRRLSEVQLYLSWLVSTSQRVSNAASPLQSWLWPSSVGRTPCHSSVWSFRGGLLFQTAALGTWTETASMSSSNTLWRRAGRERHWTVLWKRTARWERFLSRRRLRIDRGRWHKWSQSINSTMNHT